MKGAFSSLVKLLRSSNRTILLIIATAVITIATSAVISIWSSRTINFHVPSLGTIKTIGVDAYWDRNLKNKTETINWGTIQPGTSKNVTFYIRSVSNLETTLHLNTTNWNPANISDYMSLSWNYNGTTVHPDEIIKVTLTLSASSSNSFILYLVISDVKDFSFDIIISTLEHVG